MMCLWYCWSSHCWSLYVKPPRTTTNSINILIIYMYHICICILLLFFVIYCRSENDMCLKLAFIIWAVLLVNDNGRPLIVHHNGRTWNGSKTICGIWPCFNPNPIVCASECAIPHYQSSYLLIFGFTKPAYAYPSPGPQYTSVMLMFLLSCSRDMQSSPVPITELKISTPLECPMWIPSMLGPFFGAEMWRFLIFRL